MKKKLNEGVSGVDTVKINITSMKRDYPDVNYNDIRDALTDLGATVDGEVIEGNTYMVVAGIASETVFKTAADIVNDYVDDDVQAADVMQYEVNDEPTDDALVDEEPSMDDDDLEQFLDGLTINSHNSKNECHCEDGKCDDCDDITIDDCLKMFIEEDDELDQEYPSYDDVELNEPGNDGYPAYDDVDIDDDDLNDYPAYDDVPTDIDDEISDDEFDNIATTVADDDAVVDDELEVRECLESLHRYEMRKALQEKKQSCCPGKKGKLMSLTEALKAADPKKQDALDKSKDEVIGTIGDIIKSVKGKYAKEFAAKALEKLKKEQKAMSKIAKNDNGDKFKITDVKNDQYELDNKKPGVTAALNALKKAADDDKVSEQIDKFQQALKENVIAALKANHSYLYENVRVNGKMLNAYTIQELRDLLTEANHDKDALVEKICSSLNESVDSDLKARIAKKAKLISILEEELSYRTTRIKCLRRLNEENANEAGVENVNEANADEAGVADVNEANAENTNAVNEDDATAETKGGDFTDDDLSNMFGAPQGEEDKVDSNSDAEEPADADNADTEDEEVDLARVVITMKDRDAADDLKQSCVDAGIPENAMEIQGDEPESSDAESSDAEEAESNESVKYSNIDRLFEDDENSDEASDAEAADDETEQESESVKFILTDTDYISKLADVLDDVYGITRDQLEDMIGGEIVDETGDDEGSSDAEGDAEGDDTAEDDIDIDDLFKNM